MSDYCVRYDSANATSVAVDEPSISSVSRRANCREWNWRVADAQHTIIFIKSSATNLSFRADVALLSCCGLWYWN